MARTGGRRASSPRDNKVVWGGVDQKIHLIPYTLPGEWQVLVGRTDADSVCSQVNTGTCPSVQCGPLAVRTLQRTVFPPERMERGLALFGGEEVGHTGEYRHG